MKPLVLLVVLAIVIVIIGVIADYRATFRLAQDLCRQLEQRTLFESHADYPMNCVTLMPN